jgi:Flp pilus assembly protein protease CpaA
MLHPLFPLILGSALLMLVAGWDITRRRIPNWANAALGATGIGAQAIAHGGWAALGGLGAAVVTLVVLWAPWTKGRLGGGDVKACLCAVTWLGLGLLMKFFLATAVLAGVLAIICFFASSRAARKDIAENVRLLALKADLPDAPMRSGGGRISVPFGAAAACGALLLMWWG